MSPPIAEANNSADVQVQLGILGHSLGSGGKFNPFKIVSGDKVDHPGHCVRTVKGGGTIRDDFDPGNGNKRNQGRDIDKS